MNPSLPYYQRGFEHGLSAGSWVIDGNTNEETARRILQGIVDGDPEVMDMMPAPLSDEWAGESVYELIPETQDMENRGAHGEVDETCSEYEEGYAHGYWDEVQRSAEAVSGVRA